MTATPGARVDASLRLIRASLIRTPTAPVCHNRARLSRMNQRWDADEARQTPVTDGCLWCKGDVPDADRTPVGESEYLCPACLGDLREWKRYRFVEFYVSAGLEPAARRITLDHYQAIQAELAAVYDDHEDLFPLPTVKTGPDGHEIVDSIDQ